jgi:hypothetical protein
MIEVLQEREAYLRKRIVAKKAVGWDWWYDERERAGLEWAIRQLGAAPFPEPDHGPQAGSS